MNSRAIPTNTIFSRVKLLQFLDQSFSTYLNCYISASSSPHLELKFVWILKHRNPHKWPFRWHVACHNSWLSLNFKVSLILHKFFHALLSILCVGTEENVRSEARKTELNSVDHSDNQSNWILETIPKTSRFDMELFQSAPLGLGITSQN